MTDRRRVKTRYPGVYYRLAVDGRTRLYEIAYRGTDGRQRFERVEGGERDAVEVRNRILDRMAHGHTVAPTKVTLGEFAPAWLEEQSQLKPKTISSYRWAIDKVLVPRLGTKRLVDINVNHVAGLIADLQKEGKKAWTIRGVLTPLSRIMATAVRRGLAPANPVAQLEKHELPKGDQARMEILDSDGIGRLLGVATATYKPLLATAVFTGMRIGELLALRWDDVDWDEGVIHVRDSKTRAGVREVVLMPALQQLLAKHSLEHEGSTYVFETRDGEHMKQRTVLRALAATLKRAKLPHMRFHDLRHTYASILIDQGHPETFICEQLGHANASITRSVYGHLFDRKKRREEARNRLEAAFGEVLA